MHQKHSKIGTALAAIKPILKILIFTKLDKTLNLMKVFLLGHGIELQGVEFDMMLLSYTLNSTGRHNMDDLAKRYLGQ